MLLNDFFSISNISGGPSYSVNLKLNPNHRVYDGHFPGNPIAPGVCLVQMTKETLESILDKKLFLTSCNNIKFTAVLNPFIHSDITLTMDHKISDNGMHHISGALTSGEIKFLSIKGEFREI